jgi:hypothetical protein
MKEIIRERREQIRRDFDQFKVLGWANEDIYEELGKRYFLSCDTIRQNVHGFGGYSDEPGKEVKP